MVCHGKNVLIIVQNLSVPFDNRVWQQANALKDANFGVFVVCIKGKAFDTKKYEMLNGIQIYRHSIPIEGNGLFGYFFEYIWSLWSEFYLVNKIVSKNRIDFIQACNPPDLIFLVAKYFKNKFKIKFIFDHHDINPELYLAKGGKKNIIYKLLLYLERETFKAADFSIATNESYKKIAIDRGKMLPKNVQVVRSGPSLKRLYSVEPNGKYKNGKKFLVAYLGTIGQHDSLHYLLNAIAYTIKNLNENNIQYIIMGDGPERHNMEKLAQHLKIDKCVNFTGRVSNEELRTILSTSDVCVNSDEVNSMNDKSTMNKIMEYMAMAKPIVQFNLKEGKFSAEQSSLYAKENDYKDLAKKISWLLQNPEERKRMGEFGYNRFKNVLEWKYEASKYLSVFDRLLKG